MRFTTTPCHASPAWDPNNATHGRVSEVDEYDTNGTTLLRSVDTAYTVVCPAHWVTTPTPTHTWHGSYWGTFDGMLVSQLDLNNPVANCDMQTHQMDTDTYDGAAAAVHATVSYVYDGDGFAYGRVTSATTSSNGSGTLSGSPTTLTQTTKYGQHDHITYLAQSGYTNGIP